MEGGPLLDNVVSHQRGREVHIDGIWLIDFASCNYLGFDLEPQIMKMISSAVEKWGIHPSWSRIIASPALYESLEEKLAAFIGVPLSIVLPTLTITHIGLIPALVGKDGLILLDRAAHKTMHDGCVLAANNGASVRSFRHNDLDDLERSLKSRTQTGVTLICVDGVYSMSGNLAPLPALQELAARYCAIVYVDDAHGIGIIGQMDGRATTPYGSKGNGIVNHFGLTYEHIVYVSGLSKAFSSLCAFIGCTSNGMKTYLKGVLSPYSHSGPLPTASLATAIGTLELNDLNGDARRQRLYGHCRRIMKCLKEVGLETDNTSSLPVIGVRVGDSRAAVTASEFLRSRGLLVTPGVYPFAPRDSGVVRLSITASHTYAQIEHLLGVLRGLPSQLRAMCA
jgi:8-amino-7-oxononanoate synthase